MFHSNPPDTFRHSLLARTLATVALLALAIVAFPATSSASGPHHAAATPLSGAAISGTVTTMPARSAKHAVVYLVSGPPGHALNPTVLNKRMAFVPYVSIVTLHGTATFTDRDPFPHNVFSPDHEGWDLGLIQPNRSKSKRFDNLGAYTLLCNIHPGMKGYLLVLPSSYYGKADDNGRYSIANVPPGTYRIEAWAPVVRPVITTVHVGAGGATLNFRLHR